MVIKLCFLCPELTRRCTQQRLWKRPDSDVDYDDASTDAENVSEVDTSKFHRRVVSASDSTGSVQDGKKSGFFSRLKGKAQGARGKIAAGAASTMGAIASTMHRPSIVMSSSGMANNSMSAFASGLRPSIMK